MKHVDWVDVVKIDGVLYFHAPHVGKAIDRRDLGDVVARTRCRFADDIDDPQYEPRDGDAAFLEVGTPIYEVTGYEPSFRVAAVVDGKVLVYEANTVEGAQTGADLLDIDGKVDYIGINSPKDETTELARIEDRTEVARLVSMVIASEVNPDARPDSDDEQTFVAFHLHDGSTVVRAFYPDSRLLWHGLVVPQPFADAIRRATDN